jgi:Cation/multidrug efflux pump
MKIYETAVNKPVSTILIFVGVMVIGLFSFSRLSIDLYPEIEVNVASVITTYAGASAADIEQNVTKTLENGLSTVTNLKKITSNSKDNVSIIILEFEWGSDMDEALSDVRSKVDMVKGALPDNVETPVVIKFSTDMMPVYIMSAETDHNFAGLYKILEDKVTNPLSRINGVASASISGAPQREIQVHVDPQKLEAYRITVEQLAQIIAAENMNVPGGSLDVGSETFSVRVEGEFTESDQIKDIIIGSFRGRNILMSDVATVKDTLKERSTEAYSNGVRGATIIVQKQSGANAVQIANKIAKELPKIQQSLPPDVKLQTVIDTSEFIRGSINSLTETVLFAFLFVMIVVLFFLGRWRATLIIILTIPISLVAAFIYLMITGNTLNIISLSSLSIAIGMVVDDAIVVLENITSHIERGSRPRDAAIYATNEVAVAVIASTLTIVAVFMPLTMISGLSGIMFKQLGWIVTIVIIVSTVVALTVTPMLCSKMLRLNPKHTKFFNIVYGPIERGLDKLDRGYAALLAWCIKRRFSVILAGIAIFAASLLLVGQIGTELFPASDNASIEVSVELPVGTRVEEARTMNTHLQDVWSQKYPEVRIMTSSLGQSDGSNFFMAMQSSGTHMISYRMRLTKSTERDRSIFDIADEMRKDLAVIPELYRYTVTPGGSMGGGMGGSTIEVEVLGHNLDDADRVARDVSGIMETTKGLRDVKVSREDYMPQLQVVFDRQKLSMNGLTMATAAQAVRNRINGLIMSQFRENGEEYDIVVRHDPAFRQDISDIKNLMIYNNQGQAIRLSEVGEVVEGFTPPSIDHLDRERVIMVTATIYQEALGDVAAALEKEFGTMNTPDGITVRIGGSIEDQQESFNDIFVLLILVIILVYIVMATQFESFRDPFIILFSLPFACSGVFLALWLTSTSLSLIALIGAVMLVGIVVKNGIVLIDYINLSRERGVSLMKSVVHGGRSRLRPVLMTTVTTILGMFPMAMGLGEGSEIWQPMGIAIIGGLTLSTILTLLVVPVIYTSFNVGDIKRARKRLHRDHQKQVLATR